MSISVVFCMRNRFLEYFRFSFKNESVLTVIAHAAGITCTFIPSDERMSTSSEFICCTVLKYSRRISPIKNKGSNDAV